MNLSFILLFICAFHLMATNTDAQNVIIELNSGDISVGQLLNEIEQQTDYLVLFRDSDVDVNRVIHIENNTGKVISYLDAAFKKTDILYEFQNNYILLSKKGFVNEDNLPQQRRVITGTVTDEQLEPVIGANIVEKGTTNGVITDLDGNFSITVSDNAVLQISYVGYLNQEIVVEDRTFLNIVLKEELQSLDEFVVTALGIKKEKVKVAYAVQEIKGENMVKARE